MIWLPWFGGVGLAQHKKWSGHETATVDFERFKYWTHVCRASREQTSKTFASTWFRYTPLVVEKRAGMLSDGIALIRGFWGSSRIWWIHISSFCVELVENRTPWSSSQISFLGLYASFREREGKRRRNMYELLCYSGYWECAFKGSRLEPSYGHRGILIVSGFETFPMGSTL